MSPTCQVTRFDRRGPSAHRHDARSIYVFPAEVIEKLPARGIVPHDPHRQNTCAQIRKIICGVCAASGDELRFAVTQDQYRRFTRDSGDFAEYKFVGHEIGENSNRLFREAFDELLEPCKVRAQSSFPIDFTAFLNTSKSITSAAT